ncbi:hypothetical protein KXR53_07385 [Inquilinus limosus]|uniref:hypothetical protein n=1 Tax=Inquilinus limosus TaxID=171674 RepID=UPI003F13540F
MILSCSGRGRMAVAGAAVLLLLTAAAGARAALPPYWQRLREIQAILDSNELAQKLRDTPIDRIERPGEDLYRIQAGPCTLDIRIVDDPSGSTRPAMPGPRRFHIEAGEPSCR